MSTNRLAIHRFVLGGMLTAVAVSMPGPAFGQAFFTATAGVHFARTNRPQRALGNMISAKGEALVLGASVGGWFTDRLGSEASWTLSRNHSWEGNRSAPEFSNNTTFLAARLLWRPFRGPRLQVGVGPAGMIHHGTGTSLLRRSVDLGGVASVGLRLPVARIVGMRLELDSYMFSSDFTTEYRERFEGGDVLPPGRQFRVEPVLHLGLEWAIILNPE